MKKLLILLFLSFSCCAMQYKLDELFAFKNQEEIDAIYSKEEQDKLCQWLIYKYKKDLNSIVKTGIQTICAVKNTTISNCTSDKPFGDKATIVTGGNHAIVNYFGDDNKTVIYNFSDVSHASKIKSKAFQDNCRLISISPCGNYAAIVDNQNTIRLWNIEDFDNISSRTLDFFEGVPTSISINSKQQILITQGNKLVRWSPDNSVTTKITELPLGKQILSQDGTFAVGTTYGNSFCNIILFDETVQNREGIVYKQFGNDQHKYHVTLSHCNKYIFASRYNGIVIKYSSNFQEWLKDSHFDAFPGNGNFPNSISVSPCGKYIYSAYNKDGHFIDIRTKMAFKTAELDLLRARDGVIGTTCMLLLQDNQLLILPLNNISYINNFNLFNLIKLIKFITANGHKETIECYENLKSLYEEAAYMYLRHYVLKKYLDVNTQLVPDIQDIITEFVSDDLGEDYCTDCKRDGAEYKCSACKVTKYCSRECQQKHWKIHKPTCKRMKNLF